MTLPLDQVFLMPTRDLYPKKPKTMRGNFAKIDWVISQAIRWGIACYAAGVEYPRMPSIRSA
jgi:hypothetical protein